VPRLHPGVQGGAPRAPRGQQDLCEAGRSRRVPGGPAPLPDHPLQPVRRPSLRAHLPHRCDVPEEGRDRGLRPLDLHRVQSVHGRMSVRRHLHRPREQKRGEVQLLRPPHRHGIGTGVRGGLPRRGHRRWSPERGRERGQGDPHPGARDRPEAGEGDAPQALLHRWPRCHARTGGRGTPAALCLRREPQPSTRLPLPWVGSPRHGGPEPPPGSCDIRGAWEATVGVDGLRLPLDEVAGCGVLPPARAPRLDRRPPWGGRGNLP